MARAITTTRRTYAVAAILVAVLLRVLLPALHTHGEDCHGAPASQSAPACSCGVVHAWGSGGEGGGDQSDAAPVGHHCLACELEEGTPCNGPTAADASEPASLGGAEIRPCLGEVFAVRQLQLPQPRAPPSDTV